MNLKFGSGKVTFRNLFVIGVTIVGLNACRPVERVESQGSIQNPLVGAWLIIATSVTGPTGTTINENPQPGLYIFTDRHFSNMLIPGPERLPFRPDRTDEDRLAAYDNFIADAGTYEFTESTFTVQNIIAKVPNVMPPHRSTKGLTYRWHFEGDSLILTLEGGWAPPNGEITYRLQRLE